MKSCSEASRQNIIVMVVLGLSLIGFVIHSLNYILGASLFADFYKD